ncbi:hypothetical protein [Campylobacter sp. 19-13652]|uniref:hypothetical protein n=1 Tax=Campylobacter sp. 19-13652 TaxID=2840180 RepID=UPI001C743FF6|nr:hypothetical protein [Campylobacter sp. 19-13652]BCX79736.1 hypothetical protein LBC_11980 [Campylobacter sp. 19-13652]
MRVALVNNNTAVSRLITLSLNKISAQYVEGDEPELFEGEFDVAVLDSDAGVSIDDVLLIAPLLIYLAPRGGEHPKTANAVLEKPFLPTEFITAFNDITSGLDLSSQISDTDETELSNDDELADFDDIEGVDDLDNLKELDEIKFDDAQIESVDDISELDEIFTNDERSDKDESQKASDELIQGDEFDDEMGLDELDALLEADEPIASGETLPDEASLDDVADDEINLNSDDEASLADAGLGELSSLVDEIESMEVLDLDEVGVDEPVQIAEPEVEQAQGADAAELDELLDELDLIKDNASEPYTLAEPETVEAADKFKESEIDEIIDSIDDVLSDESEPDDLGEVSDNGTKQSADYDAVSELDMIDEGLINMLGDCDELEGDRTVKKEPCKSGSLDDITEEDMLAAMGLSEAGVEELVASTDEAVQMDDGVEFDLDEIKDKIGAKVASEVKKALSQSELRDALKGMKISVDISFEDEK